MEHAPGNVTYYRVPVPKALLMAMPEAERTLFLMLGHLANELHMLNALQHGSSGALPDGTSNEGAAEVHKRFQDTQTLLLIRILIGKLNEAWQLLTGNFYGAKLSKTYVPLLSDHGQQCLDELKRYFKRKGNVVHTVRNNFGFHYSPESVAKALPSIPEDETGWEIIYSQRRVNTLYYASEMGSGYALLATICPGGTPQEAMKMLFSETADVTHWMTDFVDECLALFAKTFLYPDRDELEKRWTQVVLKGVPHENERKISAVAFFGDDAAEI